MCKFSGKDVAQREGFNMLTAIFIVSIILFYTA